jgi:glutamate 5-kinase
MVTKLQAAEMATRSGTLVHIAAGTEPDVLLRLVDGEAVGTRFRPVISHIESRKRWILAEPAQGDLVVDEGAAQALTYEGRSLLAVGVTDVQGAFERGQTIRLLDHQGQEIARGVARYNARDMRAIQGHRSGEIIAVLGYEYDAVVVHRDDLVLV